jgi:hypothetical protein
MKYLLLATLALSLPSFAADKTVAQATKKKVDMTQLGKIDQKTLEVEPNKPEDVDLVTKDHGMKIDVSCKLKDGTILKQGQAGYDSCLQQAKIPKGSNEKPGADVNVQFGN